MKNEIIIYHPDNLTERIEVKMEDETVWLSQQQMAILFNQTKQNISLHIQNCFKEKELEKKTMSSNFISTSREQREFIFRNKTDAPNIGKYYPGKWSLSNIEKRVLLEYFIFNSNH